MANPIEPTPTLYGEDAVFFLKQISKPPTPEKIEFMKEVLENYEKYGSLIKCSDENHTSRKKEK